MNFDDLVDDSSGKAAPAQQPAQPQTPALPGAEPKAAAPEQHADFDSLQDDSEKYGTTGQQVKTALEGAAKAATFGLSTGLEKALGVKAEDIEARERENPIAHGAGELAGLAGSSLLLPGAGAAGAVAKAGELAAGAVGLGEATRLARIGSQAVKMAAESAAFTSGDEIHKMMLDPSKAGDIAANAVFDLGTSALIGGAGGGLLGGAGELWKASSGTKLANTLKAVSDKVGGIESIDPIDEAIATSGATLTPEARAMVSQDPMVRDGMQRLSQSSSLTGTALREEREKLHKDLQSNIAETLGKTPEQIEGLSELSEHEVGANIRKSLKQDIEAKVDPLTKKYEQITEKFKSSNLNELEKQGLMDSVIETAHKEGWDLSPSSPQAKQINNIINEIPNLNTAEDLRKYASNLPHNNNELRPLAGKVSRLFGEAGDSAVERVLGQEAPELLAEHAEAKAAYRAAKETVDSLNDRLHVGYYKGPKGFLNALEEMNPETIAKRLATKSDASLLTELSEKFPAVAEQVKDFHLDRILKKASDKAVPGQLLNTKTLDSQLKALSPELRDFVMSGEQKAKISAISEILDRIPKSAGGASADQAHGMPGALGIMYGLFTGHGAIDTVVKTIAGMVGKNILREGMDSSKLAFLKFMTSAKNIDSEGFKQMADFISAAQKGNQLLGKASKNLFKVGASALSSSEMPKESDRLKLEKALNNLEKNPNALVDGKLSHYMPEASAAAMAKVGNIAQLVKAAKPNGARVSPLDPTPEMSSAQRSEYNNVLNIAQQPLVVLQKLKDGNLTPKDIQVVQAMHPKALEQMQAKVTQEILDHQASGKIVPYNLRMGLSLLLNSPVDSTFSPQNILAAQPKPPQGLPNQGKTGKPPSGTSMKEIAKAPESHQTVVQANAKRDQKP